MSRPVALLDACVLYPQMLCDVMITFEGLYRTVDLLGQRIDLIRD